MYFGAEGDRKELNKDFERFPLPKEGGPTYRFAKWAKLD